MTKIVDLNIKDYLKELASDSPAPGGGAVAALNGAQGAALLSMVSNLTLNKDDYKEHHDTCQKILKVAQQDMTFFIQQVDADSNAFSDVIKGFRMPKDTDEQKKERAKVIQDGYRVAVNVPMDTARRAFKLIKFAEQLVEIGNPHAISDVGVGALCLKSAIQGSLLNVHININSKWISEDQPEFFEKIEEEMEEMEDIEERIEEIIDKVYERM